MIKLFVAILILFPLCRCRKLNSVQAVTDWVKHTIRIKEIRAPGTKNKEDKGEYVFASDDETLMAWQVVWELIMEKLANYNPEEYDKWHVYQNDAPIGGAQYRFPGKELGEFILEFDGPRSHQWVKEDEDGYRGTNRILLYISGDGISKKGHDIEHCKIEYPDKITIERVFLSNDHYHHGVEVINNGIKALGGLRKKFEKKAHREYYNDYDDNYDDDYGKKQQQEQVYGYNHDNNYLGFNAITSLVLMIIGTFIVICLLLCGCVMVFGCGALTTYVILPKFTRDNYKPISLSQIEQECV